MCVCVCVRERERELCLMFALFVWFLYMYLKEPFPPPPTPTTPHPPTPIMFFVKCWGLFKNLRLINYSYYYYYYYIELEGTNISKNVCVYVLFYVCIGNGFAHWLENMFIIEEFSNVHLLMTQFKCLQVTLCGWQDVNIWHQFFCTVYSIYCIRIV